MLRPVAEFLLWTQININMRFVNLIIGFWPGRHLTRLLGKPAIAAGAPTVKYIAEWYVRWESGDHSRASINGLLQQHAWLIVTRWVGT